MGRTYVPGRGKVQPSPASCSRYSHYPPRPECKGLASWDLPNVAAVPFSQVHPSRSASPRALLPAWGSPKGSLGGRTMPLPDPPPGKVRTRPSHADAGGLCQHPLAYLPPRWLFAFGEAPAGWGLGRPERSSLGARRALSGHLLQLLAVTGDGEAQGGRGRQKTPRVQLRLVLESRPQPGCLLCTQAWAAEPPPPAGVRGKRASGEGYRGDARLSAVKRFERGSGGPIATAPESGKGGVLSLSHIPPPWKLLGGTRLPTWVRIAL